MKSLKDKFWIASLILILGFVNPLNSQAFFWMPKFNKSISQEYKFSRNQPLKSKAKELNMVFVSDVYLYPIPVSQEKYPDPPKSKVGILYKESQVLFQEMIKDILKRDKKKNFDLVLFGGSQVADNLHWDLFLDVAYDLVKLGLDYRFMIGEGELRGPKRVKDIAKEKFFYQELNGVHIIALNDIHRSDDIDFILEQSHDLKAPQGQEASVDYQEQGLGPIKGFEDIQPCKCITCFKELGCRQSNWLTELRDKLQKNIGDDDDVFVFSYQKLKPELDAYIKKLPNLRLVAHSYDLKFDVQENSGKEIEIVNGALSVYPCTYTSIRRSSSGELQIKRLLVPLPGVRQKGKEELRDLGFNYKEYDGSLK